MATLQGKGAITSLVSGDHFTVHDASSTLEDAAGDLKKITYANFLTEVAGAISVPTSVSSAYRTSTILSSTTTGEGAALIGIEDAGTYFTGTDVEAALQELGALLPTGTIVGTTDTQTLTNKTLTSPRANQILDTNGNESITLTATASGVSYLDVASGTTGNDVVLTGSGETNTGISIQASGTGNVSVGPIVIDGDATVGAGQDNYVLTYNHSAGTWGPEASGAGTVTISGTPANNQFAVWTDASTIEGISSLTYDGVSFTVSADIDPNADGTINLGNATNRFASISVDSIDLNGTTFSGTTLSDPGVDAGLFWDDSASSTAYFTAGTGLEFSTTNLQIDSTVVQNTGATFSGAITFSGTTHQGVTLNNLTTTQRDALTPAAGMTIYNTTTNAINYYDGTTWQAPATTTSGIANVVDDTTPQLGGNLDVNGQAIVSVAAGNIPITPDTTGNIILDGLTWPNADGAANTALTTDGAGTLSFTNLSTRTETLTNKTISLTSNTVSGTTAEFNTALSDGSFATLAGTETLTNKTVNLSSNTLTGTTAQFNTALSDGSFATLAGTETLTNKTLTTPTINDPRIAHEYNAQTGTTYTLVAADQSAIITMSNASANTLTIPPNSSVAFPVGTIVTVFQLGAGATTVEGGTGVTVNGVSTGGAAIQNQYGAATIVKIATDTWIMQGDIGAVA